MSHVIGKLRTEAMSLAAPNMGISYTLGERARSSVDRGTAPATECACRNLPLTARLRPTQSDAQSGAQFRSERIIEAIPPFFFQTRNQELYALFTLPSNNLGVGALSIVVVSYSSPLFWTKCSVHPCQVSLVRLKH